MYPEPGVGAMSTAEPIGLPEPPELGTSALPDGTYAGQVVLVTGAGTGLGKAVATEFARLGAAIAILSRKPEHLDAGREAIEAVGGTVQTVTCDIREPDQIATAFDAVAAELGLPDVLVNNAGIAEPHAELRDTTLVDFERAISTNVIGVFLGMTSCVALLAARGRGSAEVFVKNHPVARLDANPAQLGPGEGQKPGDTGSGRIGDTDRIDIELDRAVDMSHQVVSKRTNVDDP